MQIHIGFAGPSAYAISWVTFPQDHPDVAAQLSAAAARAAAGTRRLLGRSSSGGAATVGRRGEVCRALEDTGSVRSVVQYGTAPGQYAHEASVAVSWSWWKPNSRAWHCLGCLPPAARALSSPVLPAGCSD